MQVISTTRFSMLRRLALAVALVLLCLVPVLVFADTPPKALLQHISSHKLVHSKKCNVEFLGIKHVECMIYADKKRDIVWLVLFDAKLDITHIARNKAGKEEVIWCRDNVCI